MIIGHAVVREDAESNNQHYHALVKDNLILGFRILWRIGSVGQDVPFLILDDLVEGAVRFVVQVDCSSECSSLSSENRSFGFGVLKIVYRTPWLHVRVSFFEEKESTDDRKQHQGCTNQVGEKVRKFGEDSMGREDLGEVVSGS